MSIRIIVLGSLVTLLGCGPTLVFPGGALDGNAGSPPSSWDLAEDVDLIQLETRPEDPYSVNIGCVIANGHLYVSAGNSEARWVRHMEENPLVRARIDGNLYDLRAVRVAMGSDELSTFGEAWTSKYSFGRDPTQFEEVWVYRLEPR